MALNSAGIQLGGVGIAAGIAYVGLASALPDGSGSNPTTHTRLAASLTSTAGVVTMASKSFTGGAASGPVLYLTYWSALTGGTYYGSQVLSGDATSNAAGQYTVNALTLTGSAT
jgi:hypothetical protein